MAGLASVVRHAGGGCLGAGMAQIGQRAVGVGSPALQALLLFGAGMHRGFQALAQFVEAGQLIGLQTPGVQCCPVAVDCGQVVERDGLWVGQSRQRLDQRFGFGARLALRHRRFEPAFGLTVDPSIVVAEFAFGLA